MGSQCIHAPMQDSEIKKKEVAPDLIFEEVHGSWEALFKCVDDFDILKHYTIDDFLQMSLNFFSDERVIEAKYSVFIERKLIKNVKVSEKLVNEEGLQSKVKDFHQKFITTAFKAIKQYYKIVKNIKYKEEYIDLNFLLSLGFLYCHGRNDTKLELIFDRFCNEEEYLERTDAFHHFVFGLLCLPSSIILFSMKMLGEEDEKFQAEIDKFDFPAVFDTYQVKDAINATDICINLLFTAERPKLSITAFKSLVTANADLQCFVSRGAVRKFLEKNNI